MAVDFNKGIKLASGFSLQATTPLDVRFVVDSIADRNSLIEGKSAYEGLIVYNKEDQVFYKCVSIEIPEGKTVNDCWASLLGEQALDDTVVHNTGDEAISGIKNFTQTPTISGVNIATEEFVQKAVEDAELSGGTTDDIAVSVSEDNQITADLVDQAGLVADTYAGLTVNAKGIVTAAKKNVVLTDEDEKGVQTVQGRIAYKGVVTSELTTNDLVTKEYVDQVAQGNHPQKAVVTAAVDPMEGTYATGSDEKHPGVGAKLTVTLPADGKINGVAVAVDDRVLIAGQTNETQNGVYVVESSTDNSLVLVRAESLDGDPDTEIYRGSTYLVTDGSLQGTVWSLVNTSINFTTDPIEFVQTAAPNAYNAGSGITIDANKISVTEGNTVKVIGGALEVASGTDNGGKVLVAGAEGTAAYWKKLEISDVTSGILPVEQGGTGVDTLPVKQLVVGSGQDPVAAVENKAGVLIGTADDAPTFGQVDLANAEHITGVLPLTNGGTGHNNESALDISIGDITFKATAKTELTLPTEGTVATLAGNEELTHKSFSADTDDDAAITITKGKVVGNNTKIEGFVIDGGEF